MRIYVLGAFGFRTTLYDGQTIKTRNLLELLKGHGVDVDYYDTQEFKYNRWSIFAMFARILRCDKLFYLPAHNNLRFIFPIIFIISKLCRVDIHYFVVGGWLQEFIEKKPLIKYFLSQIKGIHSETALMKNGLEKNYGFKNVDIFPNFRINNFVPTINHEEGKLKVVFMARILKQKGLDTIFAMGKLIEKNNLTDKISVDFYGPLAETSEDKNFFEENIAKFEFMNYHGPIPPEDIYSTLENYDVMILPTHFYTEGLPGSILDAYISGIPVIVTRWKHATEFVDDGKCGFIIPFDDNGNVLYGKVCYLFDNPYRLSEMKKSARNRWHEFSSEYAWKLMMTYLN